MTAPQDLEETLEVGHQIAEALIVPCRSLVLYFSTSHQQTATSSLSRAKLLAAVRWLCDATTTTLLCLATRTRHASRGRRRPKTTKILRWVSFPLRIIAIASTAAQQHSSTAAAAALQLQQHDVSKVQKFNVQSCPPSCFSSFEIVNTRVRCEFDRLIG